jgi:hypothetical protein
MNTKEKASYIANSISECIAQEAAKTKKLQKQLARKMEHDVDIKKVMNAVSESISNSLESVKTLEALPITVLDGKTIKEYIESLERLELLIEIAIAVNETEEGAFPMAFEQRLKNLPESILFQLKDYIYAAEPMIKGSLSSEQLAVVQMCALNASEVFAVPLTGILKKLNEDATMLEFEAVSDALIRIGASAVDQLMQISKDGGLNSKGYGYALMTLGKIGQNNRREDIYLFLKELFRKSKGKLVEANALAVLGDGRIIPAIRGHVEKNVDTMHPFEYSQFRKIVQLLGGDLTDLDDYFEGFEEYEGWEEWED